MSSGEFTLRAVSKVYDARAVLSDVSLTITAGQHVAILGPSGCGKSTVLRLLAGLEAPSAGEVLLDGEVVSETLAVLTPPHRRRVAMVFQDLALWPNLSVRDNVLLGLSGAGLSNDTLVGRAEKALSLCAIESLAHKRPGVLSGGEQQRVALARAVAVRPEFLLLDEPFQGLDLVTKARLLRDIAALANNQELTLVIVTHDPLEATTLCTEALVLADGRVQETGTLENLLRAPRSELLKLFREARAAGSGRPRKGTAPT